MLRVHTRRILLIGLALTAALGLFGCKSETPNNTITSAWPKADAERVVEEPPTPQRWPFTGREVAAEEAENLTRRPMSVKIENSGAARPQTGLNSADVVYETIAEGGITRFNAIFHSKVPKTLGPVRSARLSDQWVVSQYDGMLFFSGRSASVGSVLSKRKIPVLEHGRVPRAYHRVSSRSAPHNLMLDTAKGFEEAEKKNHRMTSEAKPLEFDFTGSEVTTPNAEVINIPFSNYNKVKWEWDADAGRFLRWNSGNVHKDAASGNQVSAQNVVVLWADYKEARRDKVGSVTWDINLGGEGKVSVFKNGARFDGTWTADRTTPPTFKDADGNPIRLSVGRTWFQVVPKDVKISVK